MYSKSKESDFGGGNDHDYVISKVTNNLFSEDTNVSTNVKKGKNVKQKISKYNQDPSDLFKKFENYTEEDINSKGSLGKALYSSTIKYSTTSEDFQNTLYKLNGKKFDDMDFPPKEKSLYGEDIDFKYRCSGVVWKRSDEIFKGRSEVFLGKIEPNDIKQGILGDCYFLSSCASIAENENRIRKIFLTDKINKEGCYAVRICERGNWKDILISDNFPVDRNNNPVFSRGNGNELWVLLLEKAWSKIHGSYAQIEAGLTREVLHDLTGAPCVTLFIEEKNNDNVWNEIKKGEERNYIMTAGTLDADQVDDDLDNAGLAEGHAYSLLAGVEITYQGRTEKLVKLRNPWGNFEWAKGWGDKDPRWNEISASEKRRIGYEGFKDDGIFFMSFTDFCHFYDACQICYCHDEFLYNSVLYEVNNRCGNYFELIIHERGPYFFMVSQKSIRMYTYEEQEEFDYDRVTLVIVDKNKSIVTQTKRSDREVISGYKSDQGLHDIIYDSGTYYAYVLIEAKKKTVVRVGFAAYGIGKCEIKEVNHNEVESFGDKFNKHGGRKV